MRIVQSFWSLPALQTNAGNESLNRLKGGWLSARYHWLAWTLSCLQLRQYHDEVALVTDEAGYDLLINGLGLPYTDVAVVLDTLNPHSHHLWALGKLAAYARQTKPFLHVDGDVFVWAALPQRLLEAPLAVQGIDSQELWFYEATLKAMVGAGFDLATELLDAQQQGIRGSLNAGVFGGSDLPFIRAYCQQATAMAIANEAKLPDVDLPGVGAGMVNLVYEQLYAWCLARQHQRHIEPLLPAYRSANSFTSITDFANVPDRKTTYIHLAGRKHKQDLGRCLTLERLVRHYYPAYHERVMDLTAVPQL